MTPTWGLALDTKTGILCATFDSYEGKQRKPSDRLQNLPACLDLFMDESRATSEEQETLQMNRATEGGDRY
ncbi:hypothetical protein GRAN_4376 [Granulicella sibirica]|uniref:Uncharacterized protein n=1 Tax=Granulicella sibirica TaxID=2479048 RepID=A0A4Q0SXX6_9BACT|nr:hypothetical protein GRAN_4376 [Granulicella sibirica]